MNDNDILFVDDTHLMYQASMTVGEYLVEAQQRIDSLFGEDYAADNPRLVAAFITACAMDFDTAMRTKAVRGER